ncbi:MAG: M23 family metallopeptidase [Tissierellia bacterium]|nr:M23 family metallopeptidase [Tissierellia bacterium]MDD4725668.1 M23 family metallopeptidase [Tissierellia bacterium]
MSEINSPYTKRLLAVFMIAVMIVLGYTAYKTNEINTRAFEVYLEEELIGVVRTQEEALNIIDEIENKLSNTYSAECVLDKDLNFVDTHAKDDELVSNKELKDFISSKLDFLVAGYAISIDGQDAGILKTKEEAEEIVDLMKSQYINDTEGELLEVGFLEEIEINKDEVPLNSLTSKEDLFQYINLGADEIKTHVVEVGESFWTIAMMYDMSLDDLIEANPDKNPEKLQIADEVKLVIPTSMMTVVTVEKVEYDKDTDYETIVEDNDSMYKNQQKIKVEGQKGQSHIVSNKVKHNGKLVEEDILNEQVLKKPVDELVVKGTKEIPKTMATGIFAMPTRGRFTSGYGSRWGRMHRGIDIAASSGTHIKAADGGIVSFSGWQGTYGYMVEIDHENGYKTRYAHCSKLIVSKGTRVYKGEHIANIGSTGRSTGSHLHFEVIKNGVHVNPSKFVK